MGAFPDVCLMPPPAPTGPVPTPLPNNAMCSDLDGGAQSVLTDGNPTGIKSSFLKTSTGNEPSKATGGSVVTHATKGKAYFKSYSFDVVAEGEGVVRHFDMATHNHASDPGSTPPWMEVANQDLGPGLVDCSTGDGEPCQMSTYDPNNCPDGKTPHHIVPASCILNEGQINRINNEKLGPRDANPDTCIEGCKKYRSARAPCICVTGKDKNDRPGGKLGEHAWIHRRSDVAEKKAGNANDGTWTYAECRDANIDAVCNEMSGCDPECLARVLDAYHVKECRIKEDTPLRAHTSKKGDWIKKTEAKINRRDTILRRQRKARGVRA
jgi:hypothetical protein